MAEPASENEQVGLVTGAGTWVDAAFDVLPLGVMVVNPEKRVWAANSAAAALLGWVLEELVDSPVDGLLRWSHRSPQGQPAAMGQCAEPCRQIAARARRADGSEVPVSMTVTALGTSPFPWTLVTVTEADEPGAPCGDLAFPGPDEPGAAGGAPHAAARDEPGASVEGPGIATALGGGDRPLSSESPVPEASGADALGGAGRGVGTRGNAPLPDAGLPDRSSAGTAPWTESMAIAGEMLEVVLASRDVGEAEAAVAAYLPAVVPADAGCLWVSDTPSRLRPAVTWGKHAGGRASLGEDDCWGLRRCTLHRTSPTWPAPLCSHFLDAPARPTWTVCAPLLASSRLLGLLSVQGGGHDEASGERRDPPDPLHVQLVVRQVAWALSAVHRQQQLRRRSDLDALTEVLNRRYVDDQLELDLVEAGARGLPVSVVMVDVDRFKMVNDSFGHARGDQVLRELARLLGQATRADDRVVRLGGDEFLVVLNGATLEAATERAERIRVGAQSFCQLSAGVASYPAEAATATDLVRKADERLLAAKRGGRNQIVAKDL